MLDTRRYVGSPVVRGATVVLGVTAVGLVWSIRADLLGRLGPWILAACGLLFVIGLIHCVDALYSRWMRLTEALHRLAVRVLFGGCYLLFVPLFWPIVKWKDPLRLRGAAKRETFWVRRRAETDRRSFERIG